MSDDPAVTLRIGMGQMLVIPGDLVGNLERASDMAARAEAEGCEILVLPECLDAGWTHPGAAAVASRVGGATTDHFHRLATRHRLVIAAGFTERDGETLYNAAVLVDPDRGIVAHHRKVNELPFARELYATGTSIHAVDTRWGRAAINICADNFASTLSLGKAAAVMGARLLLSPSSWAVPPDHDPQRTPYTEWVEAYGELARATGMPVIGVSNVGPVRGGEWDGWQCIGTSLAVGYDGEALAQAPYGADAAVMVPVDVPLPARPR